MAGLSDEQLQTLQDGMGSLENLLNEVGHPRRNLYSLIDLNPILTEEQALAIFVDAKQRVIDAANALITAADNFNL